jgi:signal transduction histidine kinase
MPRSLRSRLILASLLWTGGLLALMHMVSIVFLHAFPSFRGVEAVGPVVFGLTLMTAGVLGARRSLAPFRGLRTELAAVRLGREGKLGGAYPSEVQPVIDELNALLEDREKAVKRALATAGDLAHGLKTPLALLAQEADRAGAEGKPALADAIAQQVDRMSRQVNYHLARARAAASGAAGAKPCLVAPCAEALVRTVSKLHAERGLRIATTVAPDIAVRVQREDLDEMLGELLENACKWAKSRIAVDASASGAMVVVTIDDDGSGLAPELRAAVLERGVRADEAAPGSGLGLAIVRDLAEIYGGSVSLETSPLGGVRAGISLPASVANVRD